MDINDLRGFSTVLALTAFLSVCFWAYSGRKKRDFEEAASLPFADDNRPTSATSAQQSSVVSEANQKGLNHAD